MHGPRPSVVTDTVEITNPPDLPGLAGPNIDRSPVVAGTQILYVSTGGGLTAVDAAASTLEPLWTVTDESRFTGPPVAVDGTLFLSTGGSVVAYR